MRVYCFHVVHQSVCMPVRPSVCYVLVSASLGFQAGPTFPYFFFVLLLFPTFFLCSYFSLLFFSENALLSPLFTPKMFEVTINCNCFPRSLGLCKNQINLIWAATLPGFQAGPTFPTIPTFPCFFFLCSYFSLLFSENALLSLLFSPKMFEVTKNCNFFPRLLEVCKNWINLIWAVTMQKFMKYFYFSCNSFLEHLFWYFLTMVI